jgi:hypothetical protein
MIDVVPPHDGPSTYLSKNCICKIEYYMATIQYVNTSYRYQLQDPPNP